MTAKQTTGLHHAVFGFPKGVLTDLDEVCKLLRSCIKVTISKLHGAEVRNFFFA